MLFDCLRIISGVRLLSGVENMVRYFNQRDKGKRTDRFSGDFLYIHYFGKPVIVCNTFGAAKDLLEKRGQNYSDRPVMRSGRA